MCEGSECEGSEQKKDTNKSDIDENRLFLHRFRAKVSQSRSDEDGPKYDIEHIEKQIGAD
ncbi:MAG: hypothetical protein ABEJ24_00425 [Candidatus Magasanikbacteria bacterium]